MSKKPDEDALLEIREQLLRAQKLEALGRLATTVAHDVNNMLTVIMGNGGLIEQAFPSSDSRRQLCAQIVRAGERASRANGQLMAFAKIIDRAQGTRA